MKAKSEKSDVTTGGQSPLHRKSIHGCADQDIDSLVFRLQRGPNDESWSEFFDTYNEVIFRRARARGLSISDADDIVQETIIAVTRQILNFRYRTGRGFNAWVERIALSKIIDHIRKRKPEVSMPDVPSESRCNVDASSQSPEEAIEHLLVVAREALQRAQESVSPRIFQFFSVSVLQGAGPNMTAKMFGVSVPTVHAANHKVRNFIRSEAIRVERAASLMSSNVSTSMK
jgi:RNA polymerase sigma-70 factor (ECF subfamily)